MTKAVVIRGVIDFPDPAALGEHRRLNLLGAGHAARTGQHLRRFWPGDTITADDVGAAELARLAGLGAVKIVGETTS